MFKRYKWIIVAVCMAVLLVMAMPAATAQNCESGGFYCLVAYSTQTARSTRHYGMVSCFQVRGGIQI
jgi:hypothetical protein